MPDDTITSMISLVLSVLSLALSILTAWLTLLRRGKLRMTRPTVIYFGPDGGPRKDATLKVFLRTLLYSTAKRGRVIESMYVRLRRAESTQNFNIWTYGEKGELRRGSGLFVPETGVEANHHFLLPSDGTHFKFLPGEYHLEVFVSSVNAAPKILLSVKLALSKEEAK